MAYGQSKLANVLMARELPRRFAGVRAYSVHPGWVKSKLMRHAIPVKFLRAAAEFVFSATGDLLDVDVGVQTTLHTVLADHAALEDGAFYSQKGIYQDPELQPGGWPMALGNPNDTDAEAARLWDHSLVATGCALAA